MLYDVTCYEKSERPAMLRWNSSVERTLIPNVVDILDGADVHTEPCVLESQVSLRGVVDNGATPPLRFWGHWAVAWTKFEYPVLVCRRLQ